MRTEDEIMADAADDQPFSNMSDYEFWAGGGRGCYDCANDDEVTEKWCPILSVSLLGKWPKEWTRTTVVWSSPGDACRGRPPASGSYEVVDECTEFHRRPDGDGGDDPAPEPDPPPQVDGQLDIFAVYADQIINRAADLQGVTP